VVLGLRAPNHSVGFGSVSRSGHLVPLSLQRLDLAKALVDSLHLVLDARNQLPHFLLRRACALEQREFTGVLAH